MKNVIKKALILFQSIFDFKKIRYADEEDIWNADAYFCQSGSPQKKGPSNNDLLLANLVFVTNNQKVKPIIMHDNCFAVYIDRFDEKVLKLNFRDKYLSCEECGNLCSELNYQKIALFAEPQYMSRFSRILEKFNLDVVVVDTRELFKAKQIPFFQRFKPLY